MNDIDAFLDLFSVEQQNLFRDCRVDKISFCSINGQIEDILRTIYNMSGSALTQLVNAFGNSFASYASVGKCMSVGYTNTINGVKYDVDKIGKFIAFNRKNQIRTTPLMNCMQKKIE